MFYVRYVFLFVCCVCTTLTKPLLYLNCYFHSKRSVRLKSLKFPKINSIDISTTRALKPFPNGHFFGRFRIRPENNNNYVLLWISDKAYSRFPRRCTTNSNKCYFELRSNGITYNDNSVFCVISLFSTHILEYRGKLLFTKYICFQNIFRHNTTVGIAYFTCLYSHRKMK